VTSSHRDPLVCASEVERSYKDGYKTTMNLAGEATNYPGSLRLLRMEEFGKIGEPVRAKAAQEGSNDKIAALKRVRRKLW